jgi:hypothetical protein
MTCWARYHPIPTPIGVLEDVYLTQQSFLFDRILRKVLHTACASIIPNYNELQYVKMLYFRNRFHTTKA